MGFVQFYFGLPLAMVVICLTFIPIYHKYKVYTAYEYLEKRFDLKRVPSPPFCSCSRGLGTGITIYAPQSSYRRLGWNLNYMTIAIGVLVIIYTFQGGQR
jgi:Na+/proline symporter